MNMIISVAVLFYFATAVLLQLRLLGKLHLSKGILLALSFPALICHAYLLHAWIDIGSGQNLTFLIVLSLMTWLISSLVWIATLFQPTENIGLFIFPLSALSILFAISFPEQYMINTAANPRQLIHILLSVFTFSVLGAAGLQAILLAMQERLLRYKFISSVIQKLPPLQVMESLLFRMITLGFFLLSVVLTTSFYFFSTLLFPQLLERSILVILAWIIFAILLAGRRFLGWRGHMATYFTLSGLVFLFMGYTQH